MAILPLPSYRGTPGYCGPSCLRMIFAHHGIRKSEQAIARAAHATRRLGTDEKQVAAAARRYGFTARVKDNATFDDLQRCLRKGVPTIVDWFSVDDGHYSVVVGLTKTHVILRDPQQTKLNKIKRSIFKDIWFDFKAGVPHSKRSLIIRRMIIIDHKA